MSENCAKNIMISWRKLQRTYDNSLFEFRNYYWFKMNLIIFVIGIFFAFFSASMSFYPVFQDFNETDYVVPFYKSDDYPNERDLLIMNVFYDCKNSDNIFYKYTINGDPICIISENWIFSLSFMMIIGLIMMLSGALLTKFHLRPNQS